MKYRLYTFINFYLSPIQQGIQTAHIVHELFNTYPAGASCPAEAVLQKWSQDHKTIIVLNGGAEQQLQEVETAIEIMDMDGTDYPFTSFYEDAGLGGIRTGIGIVLPEKMYDAVYNYEMNAFEWVDPRTGGISRSTYYSSGSEYAFLKLLKSKRLA